MFFTSVTKWQFREAKRQFTLITCAINFFGIGVCDRYQKMKNGCNYYIFEIMRHGNIKMADWIFAPMEFFFLDMLFSLQNSGRCHL